MLTFSQPAALMQIHRPFFRCAIEEHPEDPLKSSFKESYQAMFEVYPRIMSERAAPARSSRNLQASPLDVEHRVRAVQPFYAPIIIYSPRCAFATSAWDNLCKTMATMERHQSACRMASVLVVRFLPFATDYKLRLSCFFAV